jgi:uncharacterized protein YndB with AHSA1/START domain
MQKILFGFFSLITFSLITGCNQHAPAATERAIVETVTVKASLNDVWQAWTTSAGIKTFFAPEANIDARPGGAFEPLMDPGAPVGLRGADGMVFLALQDKKMISFTWNAPPSLPEARKQRTVVIVRFQSRGDSLTEVTLSHLGWGEAAADNEWGKTYDYFAKAWPNVLKNLQKRFETGPIDWKPWLERLEKQRAGQAAPAAQTQATK